MKERDLHRRSPRRDEIKAHLFADDRHDPYLAHGKLPQPTVCRTCGVVFADGRWQWLDRPHGEPNQTTCPACQRIAGDDPAGELTLTGTFLDRHRSDILGLIRNAETAQNREHPLQRIMDIRETVDDARGERIVVTTTDIHLPRRIGHALVDAYAGDLDIHYDEDGYFVRMHWSRSDDHIGRTTADDDASGGGGGGI